MKLTEMDITVPTQNIKTITLDIFDTILLRKIWPEGLQFLKAAKLTLPVFQELIHANITAFEIYSWREYVRTELLQAKHQLSNKDNDTDITLEEWFTELYSTIHAKYHGKPKNPSRETVSKLIDIEMKLEKEETAPNAELIEQLRQQKAHNPDLKLFYVSDMYLTTEQVHDMLSHHGVADLFDGGITSTDAGNAKHSSRLFFQLHHNKDIFKDIDLSVNLHIGDSMHSDVIMAKLAGSQALHYNPRRLRRLRTFIGRAQLKLTKMKAFHAESKLYTQSLKANRGSRKESARYMYELGHLFSQPMAPYLLHVGLMSKYVNEKHYIFVSSESTVFVEAGKKLLGSIYSQPSAAPKLNRKRAISAVAWKIITEKDSSLMPRMIKTILYGEISDNRKELYNFLLTDKFEVNEAELASMTKKQFNEKLWNDLQSAPKKYTQHLEDAYVYVKSTLPQDGKTVVICDVGWGGTVQAVYTIFADLHNYKGAIEGLYLGVHPPTRFGLGDLPMTGYLLPNVLSKQDRPYWSAVIWEYVYTNKFQFDGDEERLTFVNEGLHDGYDHFRHVHINPTDYFHKVVKKRIKRLLNHPTYKEVKAIGEIRYDFGFNDPQILRIVDTTYPRLKFWARTLIKPKATLALLVAPNNWTSGYIKHFNLFGVRPLLKLLGKIKRTNYL